MNFFAKTIFLSFLFLSWLGIAQAEENAGQQGQSNSLKSIIALNYCTFSLSKIEKYNDRIVLDEEYTNIINSINLKNIPEQKIIDIIKQLMDTMTSFRLSEMEKEKLFREYEKVQQKAVMDIFVSLGGAVPGSLSLVALANPVSAGLGVLAAGRSVYSTYSDYQRLTTTSKERLDEHSWNMTKDAIHAINELNKSFLETYWSILRESDIPDKWRITSTQIDALLESAKEPAPAVRHRVLVRLEKECGFIPSYWYYRADAAHSAFQKGEKGDFAADISFCLERYASFAGFLRKDPLRASILMFHLASAQVSPEDAGKYLAEIVEPFPMDASKRLFAALTCLKYGFYDKAVEHLQANIDLRQFEVASRTLLAEVYKEQQNTDAQRVLLQKLLKDESASNQELLFHLGKASEDEQFLKRMLPEVSGITLHVESSLYGQDDLLLSLPTRWLLVENAANLTSLRIGEQKITPTRMDLGKDGKNFVLVFEKAVNHKELLGTKSLPVTIELPTSHFPLIVTGKLEPVMEQTDSKIAMLTDKVGKVLPMGESAKKEVAPNALRFTLERIQSGASCFSYAEGKMRRGTQ